ncbi:MAG: thioredoxin family protein [Pseudomonadales bacterium]
MRGELPPLIQAALDEAQLSGKRVFIDFFAEWCGACRTMDQTTFAEASVKQALATGYVFVKVDTDEHPNVGRHFDVVGLPTVMALGPTGDIVFRHTGPLDAKPLLHVLGRINAVQ